MWWLYYLNIEIFIIVSESPRTDCILALLWSIVYVLSLWPRSLGLSFQTPFTTIRCNSRASLHKQKKNVTGCTVLWELEQNMSYIVFVSVLIYLFFIHQLKSWLLWIKMTDVTSNQSREFQPEYQYHCILLRHLSSSHVRFTIISHTEWRWKGRGLIFFFHVDFFFQFQVSDASTTPQLLKTLMAESMSLTFSLALLKDCYNLI